MRTVAALHEALDANPFAAQMTDGKQLHLFFLDAPADRYDEAQLRNLAIESEDFALVGEIFYLLAPAGIGRSKLAEKMMPFFPTRMTARNWNSVTALVELAAT
jgi:uncharacterized protein (DUF1697 family)